MADVKKAAGKANQKADQTFSAEEKAAMREAAAEARKKKSGKVDGEADILAKIKEMDPNDKKIAEAIHALVKKHAPQLESRTWYGMPAYGHAGKPAVLFFQAASKFKARYATLGFNDPAQLDDGNMWPTAFGVMKITPAEETRIAALIKKAAG
ncbi:MAG: DUF1801 domain-containing protein [Devosia sp.]